MSTHPTCKENLVKVLRFNYGLNKLGFHPFVSVNDPQVQYKPRMIQRSGLAKAEKLIEGEPTLLSTKLQSDSDNCKLCDSGCFDNEEIIRHKACFGITHTVCLKFWLNFSAQCPSCRAPLSSGDSQALQLANEKLRNYIETAHNPAAALQPMIERVERVSKYLSTEELFTLHTAMTDLDGLSARQAKDDNITSSDKSLDFGEYSEDEADFDWDDD